MTVPVYHAAMARKPRRRRLTAVQARKKIDDYHRHVADALIEQIQRGTAPWTEAWKPGGLGLPRNIKSGKPYRGGNTVWLASTAMRRQYGDERWGTYRQVRELGGQVRRGERGCGILFWQFELSKLARDAAGKPLLDAAGKPVYETKPLASPRVYRYTVFNVEQCDGLPPRASRAAAHAWDRHEEAERIFEGCGATVEHTGENRAYYDLRRDRIVLPFRAQFPDAARYYQSALHELGHWTGHPARLNRETLLKGIEHGHGSQAYAREELRAEISSMMTGDRLELGHDPSRHASYVDSWIQKLREDPREVYRAARDAQLMSDYVLDRGREHAPEAAGTREARRGDQAQRERAAARAGAVRASMTRRANGPEKPTQGWLPGMNPERAGRGR